MALGELAWHLAEVDAYMTFGIEQNSFQLGGGKPPNIERPKTVEALAPAYERVHTDAVARVKKLTRRMDACGGCPACWPPDPIRIAKSEAEATRLRACGRCGQRYPGIVLVLGEEDSDEGSEGARDSVR